MVVGTETYSLQALTATGDFELAKQTLRLLKNQSMKTNGNGRIVHEITTDGAVSNPGNTQETAQFVLTAGKVFDWTGDLNFAKEMYPAMKLGINWLLGDMDQNKDLFPEGYGIMEVYGLNAELIDVAVYTQQALDATARIAGVLNDADTADRYRQLASDAENKNQRTLLDRRRRLVRRFLRNKAAGGQCRRGSDQTNRPQGSEQADRTRAGN